jgi:hypothetical protein
MDRKIIIAIVLIILVLGLILGGLFGDFNVIQQLNPINRIMGP